jgi:hypothetical protein
MALQPLVGPWPLDLYAVGRTPWTGDQPVARPLPTHRTTQTQNKRTQTSMPRVGGDISYLRPRGHCYRQNSCVIALMGIDCFQVTREVSCLETPAVVLWGGGG